MEAAPGCTSNGVDGDHDNVLGFNREGSAPAKDKEGEEREFEFGCVAQHDLPKKELRKSSPADHFFDGWLLPHGFKAATQSNVIGGGRPISTSSRDSFCNANSCSRSSRSGGGSCRWTSSSDSSEQWIWM